MSISSAIFDFLATKPTLAAYVATRIYPTAPDDASDRLADTGATLPYIIITPVSSVPEYRMGGTIGVEHANVQFDVYAQSDYIAKQTANALRAAMVFRGAMGDEDLDVRCCMLQTELADFEPPRDGSEQGIYRRTLEYQISYRETAVDWSST